MSRRQKSKPMSPFILVVFFFLSLASSLEYNVLNYGANADGKTDSTKAFIAAWTQACASNISAAIKVPSGRFLVSKIEFKGPCNNTAISVSVEGTLVAPSDYWVLGDAGYWLIFQYVDGITLSGGVLDAQGSSLWSCKSSSKNCPSGATSLTFSNSNNILINGLTSLDSQMFNIDINGCHNVKLQGVQVSSSVHSPNTDGIHIQLSNNVSIFNSTIGTGDDCISIGPGATNLWIQDIFCGPGHGISIGSLGKDFEEAGVENVTVKTVRFNSTQNGVRIKSWGRPSNGFATSILFQNITMVDVQNPIVIDQNYCPHSINCPGQDSGVKISDITYQDIHGTSATEVAVKFDCSENNPCTGIVIDNVKLSEKSNGAADSCCKNAYGMTSGYVQPSSCLL
ncbi:polygalacturonase-like [Euphorbia lathyris]|uniref:polygalacturonase-like n=1 Tax=Euphorbia lathyris TaxID=212925 RepID=UPI00331407D8